MTIDKPLFLILLIFIFLVLWYRLKSKKNDNLVYPLAGYLKSKMPKPKWFRHFPLYLKIFAACFLILVLSGPYKGETQVKDVRQAREISLVLDYSGSMEGAPAKTSIEVTQELIRNRLEDFFNFTVFGSQAKTKLRIRGEMSDFLTIENIKEIEAKMSEKLGGSTGIGIGLFNAFYGICSINKVFSREELIQLGDLLVEKQNERALFFVAKKIKKPLANQALILISDFDFPDGPAIDSKTMIQLIMNLGIRIFLIKVGTAYSDKDFVEHAALIESSKGKSYSVQGAPKEELQDIFNEIDSIVPAPIMEKIEFEKNYFTFYFKLAALVSFITSIFLLIFKKFREVP